MEHAAYPLLRLRLTQSGTGGLLLSHLLVPDTSISAKDFFVSTAVRQTKWQCTLASLPSVIDQSQNALVSK